MSQLIEIWFDGGCRPTNPGNKYGSYEVLLNGSPLVKVSRLELGWGTNNEAEFDILIQALNWTCENAVNGGFRLADYFIRLHTDSTILKNRLDGRNKSLKGEPAKRMASLTLQCHNRLMNFKAWNCQWHGRDANVSRFGH